VNSLNTAAELEETPSLPDRLVLKFYLHWWVKRSCSKVSNRFLSDSFDVLSLYMTGDISHSPFIERRH